MEVGWCLSLWGMDGRPGWKKPDDSMHAAAQVQKSSQPGEAN